MDRYCTGRRPPHSHPTLTDAYHVASIAALHAAPTRLSAHTPATIQERAPNQATHAAWVNGALRSCGMRITASRARHVYWKDPSMEPVCTHLNAIRQVTPSAQGCEDCLKTGDSWVHLRLCLECGHVGCCDNSKNKHATKHFHATRHPIMQSFEPGEDWRWCYVDEMIV
ncbi:MAG TPA: UBP-type zinc finger domain-containing protein [Ktedonobacterales bacterium]